MNFLSNVFWKVVFILIGVLVLIGLGRMVIGQLAPDELPEQVLESEKLERPQEASNPTQEGASTAKNGFYTPAPTPAPGMTAAAIERPTASPTPALDLVPGGLLRVYKVGSWDNMRNFDVRKASPSKQLFSPAGDFVAIDHKSECQGIAGYFEVKNPGIYNFQFSVKADNVRELIGSLAVDGQPVGKGNGLSYEASVDLAPGFHFVNGAVCLPCCAYNFDHENSWFRIGKPGEPLLKPELYRERSAQEIR